MAFGDLTSAGRARTASAGRSGDGKDLLGGARVWGRVFRVPSATTGRQGTFVEVFVRRGDAQGSAWRSLGDVGTGGAV